jgi:2-oxoglutarate dehydrogenase E1 component
MQKMYENWKTDPVSVHSSWNSVFSTLGGEAFIGEIDMAKEGRDTLKVAVLHRAFQINGYVLADVDPLRLHSALDEHAVPIRIPGSLKIDNYKFNEEDMNKEYDISVGMLKGFVDVDRPKAGKWKLKELVQRLKSTYCGKIGYEFMHIPFRDETNFLKDRIEQESGLQHSNEEKLELLKKIARSHLLENFFLKKFTTHKRFGLEGLESLIIAIEAVIEQASKHGVDTFIIGMPHRGRLNVLANVCQSSLTEMCGMFMGTNARLLEEGDVKYHLGHKIQRVINGKTVTIDLLANPSHLEAVDPVTVGKVHATQFYRNDPNRVMAILIHGDAALAGQGVVYETIQMEDLYEYSTGGVIHLVANNNIGFTTTPREARSSLFPTSIATSIQSPIFHVNADCPEEVDFVSRLAADWRKEFNKSVFVDIIGYRRYGHNELDEPLFTNPKMYQLIEKQVPAFIKYQKKLIAEGVITEDSANDMVKEIVNEFESSFNAAKNVSSGQLKNVSLGRSEWTLMKLPQSDPYFTGVDQTKLKEMGLKLNSIPSDINAHPGVAKIYKNRYNMIESGVGIDWACAESLAWGSLLLEDIHVRISGEDVQRGTFSQRHAVIKDQKVDSKSYTPLSHLSGSQAKFTAVNSHLSEYGVLGFEYGYSLTNPNALILWEAQFGDFVNGAQITIDQFITSGEAKWGQQSGIVLLLPHGYDGQGAEHSSGRIERILQLSADDPYEQDLNAVINRQQIFRNNIQVVMPTNPANYFHMLRRQIRREFRKPMFVFSPKRLLRHREAVSNIEEFSAERVARVYDEVSKDLLDPSNIRKVLLCSGQVYYDLVDERRKRGVNDVAICRVEQIVPFPFDKVKALGKKYQNAQFQWVQEEPLNMGCWTYVKPRIDTALKDSGFEKVTVASRGPHAAAATGFASHHTKQLASLLDKALS